MGGEPWDYFVPYEEDIQAALEKLRSANFVPGAIAAAKTIPPRLRKPS